MTVAELRAALEALPAGASAWTVLVARDAEVNVFQPLDAVGLGHHEEETGATDSFIAPLDLEDEPDRAALALNAVCLWPPWPRR